MLPRSIFLAEFDDDYWDVTKLTSHDLQRRVRCYLLLGADLFAHPAYFWQSRQSHSLLLGTMREIFVPGITRLSLGDSPNVEEYMAQRIASVSRNGFAKTEEGARYLSWGKDLQAEAKQLDALFVDQPPIALSMSRDAKFRNLLHRDLSDDPSQGISLRELITAQLTLKRSRAKSSSVVQRIHGFVSGSPLVSVDSLNGFLQRIGLDDLTHEPMFRRRLLSLYYQANVDINQVVAGIHSLDPNAPVVNAFDPVVFWAVMERIFGKLVSSFLSDDPSVEAQDAVLRLRTEPLWQDFAGDYLEMARSADDLLKRTATELANEMELRADYARLKVLPRVWRESKTEVSWTLAGVFVSGAAVVPITSLSVAGLVVSVAAAALSWKKLRGFRRELRDNDLKRLKELLSNRIRLIVDRRFEIPILHARC